VWRAINDAIFKLCEYWLIARIIHNHLHKPMDSYDSIAVASPASSLKISTPTLTVGLVIMFFDKWNLTP